MTDAKPEIREITSADGVRRSARVIRAAFRTVATQFNMTRQNCPAHPAFLTTRQLDEYKDEGTKYFGLFLSEKQVGFIAIESPDSLETGAFWIEKLAVLPKHRHSAYGTALVTFAMDFVRSCGGRKVALGMMDQHTVLKDWYSGFGFRETTTWKFDHLPFTVCLMEKDID